VVERDGTRLVDVTGVDDHTVANIFRLAWVPGQRFDTAVFCQPFASRDHHHLALGIFHRVAVGVEQRLRGQSIIDTGVRPTWFCTADKCSTGSVRTSKSRRACTPSAACWSAPSLDRPSLRNRLPARSRLPPKHYVVEIAALLFWNQRHNGAAGGGSNLP